MDALAENRQQAVFIPALDRFATVFLQEIAIDPDCVAAVYDTRAFRMDKLFLNKPARLLDADHIKQLEGQVVVILPWVEYQNVLDEIKYQQVTPLKVICWNEFFIPSADQA